VPPLDTIGMEVGYRLIALVDRNQNGQLLGRIKGVRKKLSQELGFLIPPVHIRDNLDLAPTAYRITLLGVTAAESEVFPDRQLAINPGQVNSPLPGIATQDPAFKLPAVWIEPSLREQAQTLGYTVVDASTVIATHLNQILSATPTNCWATRKPSNCWIGWRKRCRAWCRIWCPRPCRCGWWCGCCKTCCSNRCRSGICGPSPKLWRSTAPESGPRRADRCRAGRTGSIDCSKYQ
jgi:hypothetical protein